MKKILVADDERSLRMLISATLELGNYNIFEVSNGCDAIREIEKEKPDLVILDVMMPGKTGFEVCKYIKDSEELKEIKVRDLTNGYEDNQEDGVVGYGGKLDIRPPFQREFVYDDKKRNAVIDTINKGE